MSLLNSSRTYAQSIEPISAARCNGVAPSIDLLNARSPFYSNSRSLIGSFYIVTLWITESWKSLRSRELSRCSLVFHLIPSLSVWSDDEEEPGETCFLGSFFVLSLSDPDALLGEASFAVLIG